MDREFNDFCLPEGHLSCYDKSLLRTMMGLWGSAMSLDAACLLNEISGDAGGAVDTLGRFLRCIIPRKLQRVSLPHFVAYQHNFFLNDTRRYIDVRDAGIDINVPFPVFSPERGRNVDLIIALDSGAGVSWPQTLQSAVQKEYLKVEEEQQIKSTILQDTNMAFFKGKDGSPDIAFIVGATTPGTAQFTYSEIEAPQVMHVGKEAALRNSNEILSLFREAE